MTEVDMSLPSVSQQLQFQLLWLEAEKRLCPKRRTVVRQIVGELTPLYVARWAVNAKVPVRKCNVRYKGHYHKATLRWSGMAHSLEEALLWVSVLDMRRVRMRRKRNAPQGLDGVSGADTRKRPTDRVRHGNLRSYAKE